MTARPSRRWPRRSRHERHARKRACPLGGRPETASRSPAEVDPLTAVGQSFKARWARSGGCADARRSESASSATPSTASCSGSRAEPQLSASQLACVADLAPATVTEMLDHLEADGLVERVRSDRDKRVVLVSLTRRGRTLVSQRRADWERRWQAALAEFDDEQLLSRGRRARPPRGAVRRARGRVLAGADRGDRSTAVGGGPTRPAGRRPGAIGPARRRGRRTGSDRVRLARRTSRSTGNRIGRLNATSTVHASGTSGPSAARQRALVHMPCAIADWKPNARADSEWMWIGLKSPGDRRVTPAEIAPQAPGRGHREVGARRRGGGRRRIRAAVPPAQVGRDLLPDEL